MNARLRRRAVAVVAWLSILIAAGAIPAPPAHAAAGWLAVPSGTTQGLNDVSFPDASHGYAVGSGGVILATADGGQTWARQYVCAQSSPCTASSPDLLTYTYWTGVHFPDPSHGYVVGASITAAAIAATTDGGKTWRLQQAPAADAIRALRGVRFRDADNGVAVGDNGTILATTDGGRTWVRRYVCKTSAPCVATSGDLRTESLKRARIYGGDLWIVGQGVVLRSTDMGGTFNAVGNLPPAPSPPSYTGVSFSGSNGIIVGQYPTVVLSTTDGGGTWTEKKVCIDPQKQCVTNVGNNQFPQPLWDVAFVAGSTSAFVSADTGKVLATNDGGANWVVQPTPVTSSLLSVAALSSEAAVVVGAGGTILRYSPGGAPGPPTGVQAEGVAGSASVNVSWTPPTDPGISPVTSYTVTADPSGVTETVPASETKAVVRGLANGTYTFTVRAANSGFTGPPSLPSAPFDLFAGANQGTWTAAAPDAACRTALASNLTQQSAPGDVSVRSTPCRRVGHTATVLADGRVLVAAGLAAVPRATYPSGTSASAEVYDPKADTWTPTGSLSVPRLQHAAGALGDGSVLVTGGVSADPSLDTTPVPQQSAERYRPELIDPVTGLKGTWETVAPMTVPRVGHTSTALTDGRVLVVGGDPAGTAELFDPASGRWTPTPPPSVARYRHRATLLADNRVLVTGGQAPTYEALASAEIFDPKAGTWTSAGSLEVPRVDHTATALSDGSVLVAGGGNPNANPFDPLFAAFANSRTCEYPCYHGLPTATVERFYPAGAGGAGEWKATGSLNRARGWHTATALANGKVLISGGTSGGAGPDVEFYTELYDPAAGVFEATDAAQDSHAGHTATPLPVGPFGQCGSRCGKVLVVGGGPALTTDHTVELFSADPQVRRVSPDRAPSRGNTLVTVEGSGFASEGTVVRFGSLEVQADLDPTTPDSKLTVRVPRRYPAGRVPLVVAARLPTYRAKPGDPVGPLAESTAVPFTYLTAVPGLIEDLVATPVSSTDVRLSFSAPAALGSAGSTPAPATTFVVRQSNRPIDASNFDQAPALCGGICAPSPPPGREGDIVSLAVSDLRPATSYYYAVKPVDGQGRTGPISNVVAVTTGECPAPPAAGPGEVLYQAGYSLVGVPEGTRVAGDSPQFGWFNTGAGGRYVVASGDAPATGGRGFWAYSFCPRAVAVLAGQPQTRFPLGALRGSMVGNPSGTGAAVVTGHDYAARWDPVADGGRGGYQLSGYRQPLSLAVGQGAWVFSYTATEIEIRVP